MVKILSNLKGLRGFVTKQKLSGVFVVTSKTLVKKLSWAIQEIKPTAVIVVPDGEAAKTLDELEKLLASFVRHNVDKKSVVVALGGGTVGDLAGFAAAVYLRGVPFVQVPTTFLAQVDSAHGGKNGINFLNHKNSIGTIREPMAVVLDERFLKSIGPAQLADGLAETIKVGLVKDPTILKLLEKETPKSLTIKRLAPIIKRAVVAKYHFIDRDGHDQDVRQVLNFGHTIGHGIELKHGLRHGEAVLYGMLKELEIGEEFGVTKPAVRQRLLRLYERYSLQIKPRYAVDWRAVAHDKKAVGDVVPLPLVITAGKTTIRLISLSRLKTLVVN